MCVCVCVSMLCVVDHDDSPNSPPSAVSSQGSSVDISLAREVSFMLLILIVHYNLSFIFTDHHSSTATTTVDQ